MATPVMKQIKKFYPESQIDCLVMQGKITKKILENNPDVNNINYFNFIEKGYVKSLSFIKNFKKNNYNLSITTYPQARLPYSIVSFLIGAKKRIGFDYQSHKFKINKLLFTETVKEDFSKHVVENNLKILDKFRMKTKDNKIMLYTNKEDKDFADNFFRINKIKKAVVIHAGSGITKKFQLKRWSKEKFVELAKRLSRGKKYKILLVGGPDEVCLNKSITALSGLKENKEIFLVNEDILKIAEVIRKSDLAICNDTVIGHIAAAVGTKVISLFGPTCYNNSGPYTKNRIIICKRPKDVKPYVHGRKEITNDLAEYMDFISVEEVYRNVKW